MDLHKHNRRQATDHVGRLTDEDVSKEFGGRIGARLRAIRSQIRGVRTWVISRTNAWRVEGVSWEQAAMPLVLKPLTFSAPIITGNRLTVKGAFVCNREGLYHISAMFAGEIDFGTISDPRLALIVNGVFYSWLDIETGVTGRWVLQGSDLIPLICGDRLQVAFWYNVGGTLASVQPVKLITRYGYFGGHWECDACMATELEAAVDSLDPAFGTLNNPGAS